MHRRRATFAGVLQQVDDSHLTDEMFIEKEIVHESEELMDPSDHDAVNEKEKDYLEENQPQNQEPKV